MASQKIKIFGGKNLSLWQTVIVASTLFGIMFGSGNLIFPVHLGQLAGNNLAPATIGFIITAVGIPILGVISLGVSKSDGVFNLLTKISKRFAYVITTILYLTIVPLFILPRSASISYNAGLATIIGDSFDQTTAYLIFCIVFFALMLILSMMPSGITTWIGKIINPVFLLFYASLVIIALFNPMGDLSQIPPTEAYEKNAFFNGFLEGYGTMDALAGLAAGIVIINIVKDMGVKENKRITKNLILPGIFVAAFMILIYVSSIIVGGQTLGTFEISSNGSIALSQIANHYFGIFGNAFLCITVSLACLKTCIGLATSASTAFCEMFPKRFNYKIWVISFIAIGLFLSNFGLDTILEFSVPVLSFLYPIIIVVIVLALCGKYFNYSKIVLRWTVYLVSIAALLDFVKAQPKYVIDLLNLNDVCQFISGFLPFADIGFGWFVPAICGFVIGFVVYKVKGKKNNETA